MKEDHCIPCPCSSPLVHSRPKHQSVPCLRHEKPAWGFITDFQLLYYAGVVLWHKDRFLDTLHTEFKRRAVQRVFYTDIIHRTQFYYFSEWVHVTDHPFTNVFNRGNSQIQSTNPIHRQPYLHSKKRMTKKVDLTFTEMAEIKILKYVPGRIGSKQMYNQNVKTV